ncbi:MAG TPA: AAA family ATPase [Actinomycetota bacterium]|nr:AAA family ATPase [Actinomycetota bacterium]
MNSVVVRYTVRKTLKLLAIFLVFYILAIPVLYWMYRSNRGLDWWNILGGDPRVSPEFRSYLIQSSHPLAPAFDMWKTTKALPFAIISSVVYLAFFMLIMIMQFVAIFWFLSRGRTYVIYPREYDVSFDDVRGQPEIVESTKEALTLFQGFKRFRDAGGYPPHGILFEGPPGTGKTLLGKAIAGSAKVPFVYASGTSFNNMFMGIGNLRIARLFRKARKLSNKYGGSVIFIDELDAVGGSRGAVSNVMDAEAQAAKGPLRFIMAPGMGGGMGGMYVNELLIQMDGMTMPKGFWRHVKRILHLGKPKIPQYNVMVIGATNQAATLDPALLRPGRFDRKLHVGLPGGAGREDILKYYLDKVPHEPVDSARLARATYGFTPAQIKNLVNEALIFALVDGREKLTFNDLWTAKVTEEIGLKEPTTTSARDRQMTAFHEAGHAVLAYILELDDQIQVASIIKRRDTLGVVYRTPLEETLTSLREDIRRDIVVALGGLAAEEIWFGETTTGPGSDLQHATVRAATMLGILGMGDSLISYGVLPPNAMGGGPLQAILGNPENRKAIGNLLADCKRQAVELLRANEPAVRALAERLLEKNEVAGEELEELMLAKAVARATPAFRPVLELVGEDWHSPALLEASPRDGGPPGQLRPEPPRPRPEPPTGTARSDAATSEREFEW